MNLSVVILTLNEERNLPRCLDSVKGVATEIVLIDSGSTDRTLEIAQSYGARIVHQPWKGFPEQRRIAIEQASQPWVLALDADEELSVELENSIRNFFRQGDSEKYTAAIFNRKVWFLGRWITHGDWYPDRKLRLVRRDVARCEGHSGHDQILATEGSTIHLKGDLHHYSFPDTRKYIEKINTFSDQFLARQLEQGKSWKLTPNLTRPIWRFFRAYILRRGFLDGFPGLWIAVSTAYFNFVRYSRAFEHAHPKSPPNLSPRARQ